MPGILAADRGQHAHRPTSAVESGGLLRLKIAELLPQGWKRWGGAEAAPVLPCDFHPDSMHLFL
jgi:hypothetical protein